MRWNLLGIHNPSADVSSASLCTVRGDESHQLLSQILQNMSDPGEDLRTAAAQGLAKATVSSHDPSPSRSLAKVFKEKLPR